ncbi:MAG: putative capsular polysaccharide synthesis family protein [Actinomycetota bacterium]
MTIDAASRAAYALARARHRFRKGRSPAGPAVVFSMAKTGSSAVVAGLRAAGWRDLYHVHDLDPEFLRAEEVQYRWSGRPWRIWDAQLLLQRGRSRDQPWRVISLVRDPVAQTVSAFFQPGMRHGYIRPGATIGELRDRFGDRLDRLPLGWFDSHLLPTLGIDVYDFDFDPDVGYRIIDTPTVRLLLLRCEGLEVAPRALIALLEDDRLIRIPKANVGADKAYAHMYQQFIQSVRPTPEQLDRAYSSRLVQHFYSPREIDQFRALWSDGASESGGSALLGD